MKSLCLKSFLSVSPKRSVWLESILVLATPPRVGSSFWVIVCLIPGQQPFFASSKLWVILLSESRIIFWGGTRLSTLDFIKHIEQVRRKGIISGMSSAFPWEIDTSGIPSFFIDSLSIWDFLLFGSHSGINKSCSPIAWVHDCLVVHVYLVYSIVSFCAINLSEDVLTHLVEGDFITTFLLPHHGL